MLYHYHYFVLNFDFVLNENDWIIHQHVLYLDYVNDLLVGLPRG